MDEEKPTRADASPPDPFLGQVLGGCIVDEVIGRGGMGVVYKATQLSLNRPVAIKVLPEEVCGQPQFVERFKREVDILSRLSHPNVVTVFERGEIDGRLYVIMEYVQGTSLREVMRKGPLPAAEALAIVRGVLAALEHAHDRGIVHRDIKPENVLVAPGGIVKVADFGLSRLLDPAGTTRLTHTQLLLGTYEYMAPEQREKAKTADARADIYATGVVLYEMLAGELPIGHFAALSRKRPKECDSRIDEIVEKSLAKSPDDRYQRASEMGEAVSRVLSAAAAPPEAPPRDEPASERHVARPLTPEEEARVDAGPGRRRRRDDPAGGIGCLVFLLALVAGLGLLRSAIVAILAGMLVRALPGLQRAAKGIIAVIALATLALLAFLYSSVREPAPAGPTPDRSTPAGPTAEWSFDVATYGDGVTDAEAQLMASDVLADPQVKEYLSRWMHVPASFPAGVRLEASGGTVRAVLPQAEYQDEFGARQIAGGLGYKLVQRGGSAFRGTTITGFAPSDALDDR